MPVIEGPTRFSSSLLWTLQRHSYDRQGPGAWRTGGVPLHIVSNPFFAQACAEVVFGVLRDRWLQDRHQCVTVVDLGSGSGRFGYLFLRALDRLLASSSLSVAPCRLVLTDFAEANLQTLQSHPQLQPYLQRGLLDVACFDADRPAPLKLRHSGEEVPLGSPLVLLANYFFDSIVQDLFSVQNGTLCDVKVSLSSALSREDLTGRVDAIDQVKSQVHAEPLETAPFEDPAMIRALHRFASRVNDTIFPFPTGALTCLRWFLEHSPEVVLLCNDKGFLDPGHIVGLQGLPLVRHGHTFSVFLNGSVLDDYVEARAGFGRIAPHRDTSLFMSLHSVGLSWDALAHTSLAFNQAFCGYSPRDYDDLFAMINEETSQVAPHHVLGLLRLSRWDPDMLMKFRDVLTSRAHELTGWVREELVDSLELVWDNHFFIADRRDDVALVIAAILQALQCPVEALVYLDRSEERYGERAITRLHRALLCISLNQWEEARDYLLEVRRIEPRHPQVLPLLRHVATALHGH